MVQRDKLREEFSQRLAQASRRANLDEHGRGIAIARALGVTSKAVSKWFNAEAMPRQDKMNELANFLDVSPFWLQHGATGLHAESLKKKYEGEEAESAESSENSTNQSNVEYAAKYKPRGNYPMISWVSAGAWSEAVEPYALSEIDDWYESDSHVEGKAFWLRVKGDSMTSPYGLSIPEGMLILVDTGREPKNGSLVVAKLTDANEATFKKLVIDAGLGKRFLQPLNPNQQRVEINGNCRIIGVAIEQRGSLI